MTIQEKKTELTTYIEELVSQYNKNIEIQNKLKTQIIQLQGALKVLDELEDVDQDTDSEAT